VRLAGRCPLPGLSRCCRARGSVLSPEWVVAVRVEEIMVEQIAETIVAERVVVKKAVSEKVVSEKVVGEETRW
jgi:hypothetical protein